MRGGDIILTNLPQWDGNIKLRSVLLLKQLPGYSDFLVFGISTIRLGFLAVIPKNKSGTIGKIDDSLHKNLLLRLANYLLK